MTIVPAVFFSVSLATTIGAQAATPLVPSDACAARAAKAATGAALASAADAKMRSFAKVRPASYEVGAGDAFYDVTFSQAGSDEIRYHIIMWCKGVKAPLAMAVQRKYER